MEKITINFKITADIQSMNVFMAMLSHMECCSRHGHSSKFEVFADGDGAMRFSYDYDEYHDKEVIDYLKKTNTLIDNIENKGKHVLFDYPEGLKES